MGQGLHTWLQVLPKPGDLGILDSIGRESHGSQGPEGLAKGRSSDP